jgi:3-dehydroquinate synthase
LPTNQPTDTALAHSRTLTVDLGERSYPIIIGSGLIESGFDLSPFLPGKDCLVVSNEIVAPLYFAKLSACFRDTNVNFISLPDGEAVKTFKTAETVFDKLVASHANRDVAIVALGGGVVGDIAGFAAACYMRGVAFLQVPTTLLAQVDSSVGGKTGVNHSGGKNLIGAFHQPKIVLIDTSTLETLPERELKAGLAEVIKYGAIADAEFFSYLEENMSALLRRDGDALSYAITRSCELKAEIVAADEREAGRRGLLNFGHTFGHAIENSVGYGEWLHGEAVAAGMLMAAEMSNIDHISQSRLRKLVEAAGLPSAPPKVGAEKLRVAMRMDKKVKASRVRFVLLHSLGDAYLCDDYTASDLNDALAGADA